MAVNFQAGLREVLAVNSAICAVDGEAGKLRSDFVLDSMRAFPRTAHPLEVLRAALSALVMCDPDARDNSPGASLLFMLDGTPPDRSSEEAMDAVLVLHAEHELNASTFTARLVTATVADLYSGVIPAIGAPERATPYIRALDPDRPVHVHLRGQPDRGVVRPHHGAVRRQPADPSTRAVLRTRAAGIRGA